MRSLFAAIGFLTILPVPSALRGSERELGRSPFWFPVVGLLIGLAAFGVDHVLTSVMLLPIRVGSVMVVTFLAILSGGLHLNGLADTGDGLLSGKPKKRMLEIMRDSRVGSMGGVALVCVLLLKVEALSAIPPSLRPWTILLMPLAGRCAMLQFMSTLPCVREEGGLGSIFEAHRSVSLCIWSSCVLLGAGWHLFDTGGVAACLMVIWITMMFRTGCRMKIGGSIGDTMGAASEIAESVLPVAILLCDRFIP